MAPRLGTSAREHLSSISGRLPTVLPGAQRTPRSRRSPAQSGPSTVFHHRRCSPALGAPCYAAAGPEEGPELETTIHHRSTQRRRWQLTAAAAGALGVVAALLTMPPTADAALPPTTGEWTTKFSDDFTGQAGQLPSAQRWKLALGHNYPGGATNWGTGEIQKYTNSPNNVQLDGAGNLKITPTYNATKNTWSSARVESIAEDFQPPQGGSMKVSARIKLPDVMGKDGINLGKGYWPAFWMLGAPFRHESTYFGETYAPYTSWPMSGEFDILETILNGPTSSSPTDWGKGVTSTMHCGWLEFPGTNTVDPSGGPCHEYNGITSRHQTESYLWDTFHTYSMIWDRSGPIEKVSWYLDDDPAPILTLTPDSIGDPGTHATKQQIWDNATKHGFFLLLNVAIGGAFPSSASDGGPDATTQPGHSMLVDYVAVYTKSGSGTPTTSPSGGSSADAYSQIEAESFSAKYGNQNVRATTDISGGQEVVGLSNGEWLRYSGIKFSATPATQFKARVSSNAPAGVSGLVQVRLDSPTGRVVSEFEIAAQAWQTVSVNMDAVTGDHDVYLTFSSGQPSDFVSLNWFQFAH